MKRRTQKAKLTPFERETERRRKEMLRNIGGAQLRLTPKYLGSLPRRVRKFLLDDRRVQAVRL